MKSNNYVFFILLFLLPSCGNRIEDIVQKWYNKEVKIPDSLVFTRGGTDTTNNIKETLFLIKLANFNYPMCFDQNEIFMRYNDAFELEPFQSMLLNKDNKIVVIGSPIQNRLIRQLMLDSLNVR